MSPRAFFERYLPNCLLLYMAFIMLYALVSQDA